MAEVRNDLGFMADKIDGLGKVGQRLSFAVTLPLALAGTALVKTAADFEAAMYNVASISTDVANNFDDMSRKVLEFGANTRSGAQAAAEALYEIYSVGYRGDAFELMTVSVQTAEAGLSDLSTTTRALANVLNAYASTNLTASDASNALTRTVQVGAGTLEEYATSLGRVAPVAAALGISFEELGANWAFITQQGAGVGTAATELTGILNKLLKPSTDLESAFKDLGVSGGIELIEKFGGLNGALKALFETAGGNSETFAQLFGDARAIRGILKMVNSVEDWDAAMAAFYDGLDIATMTAWEQQSLSMSASMDKLVSALQGAAIHIGTQLIPVVQPLVDGLRELVLAAIDLDPAFIQVAATFAAVTAAVGPLLWLLSSMLSPIGLIIGAVAGLAAAFATNFANIQTTVTNAINSVFGDLSGLSGGLQTIIDAIFDTSGADGSAIQGPIDDWAARNAVEVGASTFVTVKEGDTLWSIFNSNEAFKDAFTWEEFKEVVGLENPHMIHPGDIIEIPASAAAAMRGAVQAGFDFENAFKIDPSDWSADTYTPVRKSLSERVTSAVAEAWPDIREGIQTLLKRASEWITATGVPWLARKLGELVGTLGTGIGQLLGSIAGSLSGKDGASAVKELWDWLGEYVWRPFVEGLESSLPDDINLSDAIITLVVGGLATVTLGSALFGAMSKGIVAAAPAGLILLKGIIGGFLKDVFLGIKIVANTTLGKAILGGIIKGVSGAAPLAQILMQAAITTFLTTAAGAVTGGILLGVGLYFIIPEEVKTALRDAIDDLVATLFGVTDLSGKLQDAFATAMYNTAGHIANLVGNTEAADKLFAMGEEAAGTYTAGFYVGLELDQAPEFDPTAAWHLADPSRAEVWREEMKWAAGWAIVSGWRDAVAESANSTKSTGAAIITGVVEGTNQAVVENYSSIQSAANTLLTPLEETVSTKLGTDGPVMGDINKFTNDFSGKMTEISDSSKTVGGEVDTGFSAISTAVMNWYGGIITRVAAVAAAFRDMVEAATGAGNAASSFTGGYTGYQGGRAIGGPVTAMQPYMVGEHGPELFIPNVSGVVQTASMTSGRTQRSEPAQVTNVFHINGVSNIDDFIRETKRRGWQN